MTLPRGSGLVALAFAAIAAAVPLVLVPVSLAAAPVTVTVTLRDSSVRVAPKSAAVGKVTFAVTNTGKADHSFQIAGRKTPVLKSGASTKLVVTFTKAGPFAYTSTVAGDAARGMKGTFTTAAAAAPVSAAGKLAFVSGGCGVCHTLTVAGTTGTLGPNLDRSTASRSMILNAVTNGKGTMPALVDKLTPQQIQDVADFVLASRAG